MTNNPFEQFDINHLSSQSINLYLSNIPLFIVRYCVGFRSATNSAMLRGTVTDKFIGKGLGFEKNEDGIYEPVKDIPSDEKLLEGAENYFTAAIEDLEDEPEKINKELESVNKYLKVGLPFYRSLGTPESYQQRVELDFDLPVNIIGFADLTFEDSVRDIKTSARKPSAITPQVSRQLAIYAAALEKRQAVADYLVVSKTSQSVESLECDDLNMRLDEVYQVSQKITNLLSNNDINSLCDQFYPDFSDWRWDQGSIEAAKKLWSIK
jgi:hypothetical protein|tara:strand:+ start:2601 stop:3398 length:798 start_codon:yes stop_codon:yes gene_type:complete